MRRLVGLAFGALVLALVLERKRNSGPWWIQWDRYVSFVMSRQSATWPRTYNGYRPELIVFTPPYSAHQHLGWKVFQNHNVYIVIGPAPEQASGGDGVNLWIRTPTAMEDDDTSPQKCWCVGGDGFLALCHEALRTSEGLKS